MSVERRVQQVADVRVLRGDPATAALLPDALAQHRRALESGEGLLKRGPRTLVTRVQLGETPVCIKEFRGAGSLDRLKDGLRPARALRAWRAAEVLAERGVASPEPLAVAVGRHVSHLVTRYVAHAVPLDRLLRERFSVHLDRSELAAKRSLFPELGRWLRRVHDLGLYHGDWSAKNVLAVETELGWDFLLLDLESLDPRRTLTRRRRIKNLAQLSDPPFGATRTDMMRFLSAYAKGEPDLARGAFPHAVLARARRRRRRRERRLARATALSAAASAAGPA